MSGFSIALPSPIRAGLPGFPPLLRSVDEARRVIECERLPVRRSQACWREVHDRLTLARATGARVDVEAAYRALTLAITQERTITPPQSFQAAA